MPNRIFLKYILSFFLLTSLNAAEIEGTARVVDGDTIEIKNNKIRLFGIDAPESNQTCQNKYSISYKCGTVSTQKLENKINKNSNRSYLKFDKVLNLYKTLPNLNSNIESKKLNKMKTSNTDLTQTEIENHINKSNDFDTTIGVAVRVDKFSDSSIDMYVRCFTKSDSWNEWLSVKERLAIAIKQIVENNKASFAFPSSSIYIEKK